ncbi:MAG: MCE family protein, partial [Sciscionella sp.]
MKSLAPPLVKLIIFVVVTVLATGVLAFTIANTSLSASRQFGARFTDVAALHVGDDVRIAGVRVGQVKSIDIVDKNYAQIGFAVRDGVTIPKSVQATIKYRNLVGQRYVALAQTAGGDPNAVLRPGDVIGLDHTHPALDLTKLFSGFQPLFSALSPGDVNKLSYEIIQVLQGEGGTVDSLLAHTASLTQKIAGKDAVIGKVIDNLNSVLDTVNAHGAQLSNLIVTLQQLVTGLAQDRKPIGDAITALGGLAKTTSGFLDKARPPLRNDVKQLGALTDNLNAAQPEVKHFLQFLPTKLKTITKTATYGSWFNFFLCSASGSLSLPPLI